MSSKKSDTSVVFLNPRTCGIYKDGGTRYTVDRETGQRSAEIDDELNAQVDAYLAGKKTPGAIRISLDQINQSKVLVPTYFDPRYKEEVDQFLADHKMQGITIGELVDSGILIIRGGHGSPSNDQRVGSVPYIKVSDLRALRVNINPTNLVPEALARRHWRGPDSGLQAWDLISPNRASSNIGEFCMLLPGEERIVITKEVFVFRIQKNKEGWDPFYLLWALCLKPVRRQWTRVALMQTNREDVGDRYREIILPKPEAWAKQVSQPFRDYFTTIAKAREKFREDMGKSEKEFPFIASVAEMARGVFEEKPKDELERE